MHANVLRTVTELHRPMNFLTGLQEMQLSYTVITGLNFPEAASTLYFPTSDMCFK